jgi:hypothetical protein
MIITEYVEIKIGSKNRKYYLNKGYIVEKETLNVKTEDLLPTTKVSINAKCDYCDEIIETSYKNYNYNITNNGKFSCSPKCTNLKTMENNLNKYGVKYSNQRDDIKIKTHQKSINNIRKYDSILIEDEPDWEKYLLTREVIITINKWNIDHLTNIGFKDLIQNNKWIIHVRHLMPNSSVKVECLCECGNITKNSFQKFTQNYNRSKSYNCKSCNNITLKKTFLKEFGVDNPSKLEDINNKRKSTCLEKYGNEYAISCDMVKSKINDTMIERYGGHQSRNKEIMNKIIKNSKITKIERGLIIPDHKLSEWELYRRNVRRITENNKNRLFESWNGIDYYDGEYIKDNFNLEHINISYPTIDHKISVIHGFKNNIPFEIIGDIKNLCITKRGNNSSKSGLTEDEYRKKMDQ